MRLIPVIIGRVHQQTRDTQREENSILSFEHKRELSLNFSLRSKNKKSK